MTHSTHNNGIAPNHMLKDYTVLFVSDHNAYNATVLTPNVVVAFITNQNIIDNDIAPINTIVVDAPSFISFNDVYGDISIKLALNVATVFVPVSNAINNDIGPACNLEQSSASLVSERNT